MADKDEETFINQWSILIYLYTFFGMILYLSLMQFMNFTRRVNKKKLDILNFYKDKTSKLVEYICKKVFYQNKIESRYSHFKYKYLYICII